MARLPIIVPEEAKGKAPRFSAERSKNTRAGTEHDARHGQFAGHTRGIHSIQFCA